MYAIPVQGWVLSAGSSQDPRFIELQHTNLFYNICSQINFS